MNVRIPDHVATIKRYQPGETVAQLQKKFGWKKVAVLWNNENTLGYSMKSREAVIEAYRRINFYPDAFSVELTNKLAQRLGKEPNQIVLGNGSESVLMLAIRAMCAGDDEFLTSHGSFFIVSNWVKVHRVRFLAMPLTDGYGFDLEGIRNRINRNTKMIYLANVNNPTGSMITRDELLAFMQHVPDHILVVVDEAYFEFSKALSPAFPDSLGMGFPNLLTVRTFSKAYGLAGVRLGFGVGHRSVIETMMKAKLTFEPSALAQAAGIGALDDTEFLNRTVRNNTKGLAFLTKELKRLNVQYVPSYGNFMMVLWKDKMQAKRIFHGLMKRGVLVRPIMPPIDHGIRVTVGKPEENHHFIEALADIISKERFE